MRSIQFIQHLKFENGADVSNVIRLQGVVVLSIGAPAAITGTVTLEVSHNGVTWFAHSDAAFTAGEATTIGFVAWPYIRLVSTVVQDAERHFPLMASEVM